MRSYLSLIHLLNLMGSFSNVHTVTPIATEIRIQCKEFDDGRNSNVRKDPKGGSDETRY